MPTKVVNTMTTLERQYADLKKAEAVKPEKSLTTPRKATAKASTVKSRTPPSRSLHPDPTGAKTFGFSDEDIKELLFQLYLGWSINDIGENMYLRDGNTRNRDQWRKKAKQLSIDFIHTVNPAMTEEEQSKGKTALQFVSPSHFTIGNENFLVYLREAFAMIDFQSNPTTREVRVLLTKLQPHHSGRMISTLDQLTVNLVAPAEFQFGQPYEDDHWVGVHLVRLQLTQLPRSVDGFVSVMKTARPTPFALPNNNNNFAGTSEETANSAAMDSESTGTGDCAFFNSFNS